ncbi:serine/threonine-protein phosphatase 7 long form-like protein, partial [Trifolium medium]|nr:serine/threonine-protein phosphatase 7 long form-like protein [Trifolium medium]
MVESVKTLFQKWKLTPQQIKLVEKAGFCYLRLLPAMSLDNALIAAL